MAWVLTTALQAMRSAWRTAFPNSNTAQDGTIGDAAHKLSTSGHNPDDTAGSRSEYSDADSKQEVRALDKDARLNAAATMQQVIDRILATPADRDRLAYIIFNGYIWRKRNGWRRETYTGSDKHREHAHFSGDPVHDENGAPWTSVLSFADNGGYTVADSQLIANTERAVTAWYTGMDPVPMPAPWPGVPAAGLPNPFVRLEKKVDGLAAGGAVDAAAVAEALAGNQAFIGAIAHAVAEELQDPAALKRAAKDGAIAAAKVIADAVAQIP